MVSPGIHRLLALLAGRLPRLRERDGHRRPSRRSLALMVGPKVLVLPLLPLAASGSSATSSQASSAAARSSAAADSAAPTVNLALAGQASATSSESANPASRAIDGDAGTDWCTSSWTGSLVIDLGQIHSLSDLGITLDATSPSASATIQVARQSGAWQPVPAARNVALDPGHPM